jgi:3-phenylpropionate/trans-cinnamate dioxygenase ferredoxin reductase component
MTNNESATVVIAGAGHATAELVTALRQASYSGRIVAVGDEAHLPYQRPPLSKAYLSGEATLDSLYLKSRGTYEKAQIEFHLGTRVDEIDRKNKRVVLSDGHTLEYTNLVLNTGGRARRLSVPGADRAEQLSNFRYVRTIDDIDRLRRHMQPGLGLVIIGGGCLRQGKIISADTINRPQEFMIAKRLVAEAAAIDPTLLADESIPLKTLLPK